MFNHKHLAATAAAAVALWSSHALAVVIPEGTEIAIRFDDSLSSGTNAQGDRFSVTLDDDIVLADGTKIAAGYKGVGEVTDVEKRGMMGQAGKLNVRLNYIKFGDTRLRLRGSRGGEGKDKVGTTIVLTVLFGPLGLLKRGKDIVIPAGQAMTVYADEDATLGDPLPPPPST